MGYFSSRYSSQPHTLRMYLPWYSWTHIFSCSGDSSMLRVFFRMASAITCRTDAHTRPQPTLDTLQKSHVEFRTRMADRLAFSFLNIPPTCSGTQSWLIFNVYFCLSLFGETITQITTIIWPAERDTEWEKADEKATMNQISLAKHPRNNNHPTFSVLKSWPAQQ